MNTIPGIVNSVMQDDLFARIDIECKGLLYSALLLRSEDESPYCKIATPVFMVFKETDTIVALNHNCNISCRNRFLSKVVSVVYGPIITRITTDYHGFPINSIVTTESARSIHLENGSEIVSIVKSTSMMLSTIEQVNR